MQFTTFGKNSREGSYLLLINLRDSAGISFGRFMGGREIRLDQGSYLYVGSALGSGQGAYPLASRLLRHASRSAGRSPHQLRERLMAHFKAFGFEPKRERPEKKLHWHIDFLLDLPEAELAHVVMVAGPARLEHRLAELAASMPGVSPVADRLGAQDAASGTHLFRVEDPGDLLERLNTEIAMLIREA
ncbi:MAG: DUF123 domain-containing protein [Chlorobiaceae bacterium]|nr:DUF123 domain-containing protein [Chlorobiaceae bacterium]